MKERTRLSFKGGFIFSGTGNEEGKEGGFRRGEQKVSTQEFKIRRLTDFIAWGQGNGDQRRENIASCIPRGESRAHKKGKK